MGREIRMVIPNWEHPKKWKLNNCIGEVDEVYIPKMERNYADDMEGLRYAEWSGGPPDHEYYMPEWDNADRTWYQVYETVSEGTPVTPPFETQEELINYLTENGDFWDQDRRNSGNSIIPCAPWKKEDAERFVKYSGYSVSGIFSNGVLKRGFDVYNKEGNSNGD